jgi:signal transduction histidine kinase
MTVWDLRTRPTPAADANVVRAAAWVRLVVLVAVAGTASLVQNDHDALFLVIDLVWIPWATAVLLAADVPGRRLALLGGPLGDVAGLVLVQLVVPESARGVLFGYLVVVTFATFTAGRVLASTLAATTVVVSLLASEADNLSSTDLVPFALGLTAVILLARRSISVHALVSARAEGLQTKADVILATAVGAVVVTDEHGTLREANPAAERLISASGDLVGRHCADVLGLHAGARALDCSQGCPLLQLEQDAAQGVEVWRTGPTGEKQPVLARAVTLATTDGAEVVHSLQDITRLKQAEEAKTLFLATASHELKTPLTVINGFAETLAHYGDLDAETQKVALSAILSRGKQLTRVVDRLLLSSRIDAGKVSLATGPVQVLPVLRERAEGLAQATGRRITCDLPDALEDVRGETDALITVVDHLLENALKYSPDGGDVEVAAQQDADGAVLITVRDHGIGMDEDQAAHCFEKFWQAESTDVRRFGGTGIGLYIVHSLVDAMGGRITVTSAPGSGTAFTLRMLPIRAIPEPREAGQIREFMRQIGVPSGTGSQP